MENKNPKVVSTPLVQPKQQSEDAELQKLIDFYNETLGFCPNSVLTMYHRPEIAYAFIALNKAVMKNEGRISSSLKRLMAYVSSHATGCRYCQAHTIRAAERYGADKEKLEHIWEYATHPAFDEAERVALDFAIQASTVPNSVDDELNSRLKTHWDDGEIVEMMGVIALFGFLNRWNDSMGTTLEEDAKQSAEKHLSLQGWNPGKHS